MQLFKKSSPMDIDPRSVIRYDFQYHIGMSTRMYRFSVHYSSFFSIRMTFYNSSSIH